MSITVRNNPIYQTPDGLTFDTLDEAENHHKELEILQLLVDDRGITSQDNRREDIAEFIMKNQLQIKGILGRSIATIGDK